MAEESFEEKTEQPTPKKRRELKEKGRALSFIIHEARSISTDEVEYAKNVIGTIPAEKLADLTQDPDRINALIAEYQDVDKDNLMFFAALSRPRKINVIEFLLADLQIANALLSGAPVDDVDLVPLMANASKALSIFSGKDVNEIDIDGINPLGKMRGNGLLES